MQTKLKIDFRQGSKVKIYNIVITSFFLLSITLPIFSLQYKDFQIKEFTDRKNFDAWFVAKSQFINNYKVITSGIRFYLLGLSPAKQYFKGENGMFIKKKSKLKEGKIAVPLARPLQDLFGHNPYTARELKSMRKILMARKRYLNRHGIKYLLVLIPRKSTIYPEIFSRRLRQKFSETNLTKAWHYLKNNSDLNIINLKAPLIKFKHNSQQPLYFKTDAHWNKLAAFAGYQAVLKQINKIFFRRLKKLSLRDFSLKIKRNWCHHNFKIRTGICPEDQKIRLIPKPSLMLRNQLLYELFLQGFGQRKFQKIALTNQNRITQNYRITNNPQGKLNTGLLLSASFGEKMAPFLSYHFKKLLISREIRGFQTHLFDISSKKTGKIDIVIQTMVEGVFHKKSKLFNPDNL